MISPGNELHQVGRAAAPGLMDRAHRIGTHQSLHPGKGPGRPFVGRTRSAPQTELTAGFGDHLIGHQP